VCVCLYASISGTDSFNTSHTAEMVHKFHSAPPHTGNESGSYSGRTLFES